MRTSTDTISQALLAGVEEWRLILWLTLLAAGGAATRSLLQKRVYDVDVAFSVSMPNVAGISGLAATLGVDLGSNQANGPDFFVELLASPDVLRRVVTAELRAPTSDPKVKTTLLEYYGYTSANGEYGVEKAMRAFRQDFAAVSMRRIGLVKVSISMKDPELAAAAAKKLVDEAELYNRERRKSQATAEKEFAEARMNSIGDELKAAEDVARQFVEANVGYASNPSLMLQFGRMDREIRELQGVHSSLREAYEDARIAEVRDTPLLTVMTSPRSPPIGLPRRTAVKTIFAAGVAFVFGFVLAWFRQWRQVSSLSADDARRRIELAVRAGLGRYPRLRRILNRLWRIIVPSHPLGGGPEGAIG